MIKFNDLKITSRNQNYKLSREYPRLYRYIKDSILRKKPELPKILEVNLWNWDSKNSENTSISYRTNCRNGINYDFKIDVNLRQLLRYYKNPDYFKKGNRLYPGKIKGIRKYLLFAIYHEIGHYYLKNRQGFENIEKNDFERENFCDKFAFERITQGQKDFEFIIPESSPNQSPLIQLSRAESPKVSPASIKGIDKDLRHNLRAELKEYRARAKDSRAVLCFTGENKKIKIYHYSNQDFKGYIKPGYFGLNHYSRESVKESGLNRAFFYIGKGKEDFLSGAKFLYIAEIESAKIYDFDRDIKDFKNSGKNFNEILLYVKKLGYFGISGNNGFRVVCLFRDIKYIDKKILGVKGCRLSYEIGKSNQKGGKNV